MDTLPRISAIAQPKVYTYDFFFNKIDYCLSKGKGFSLFNADEVAIASFLKSCAQKGFAPLTLRLSSLESVFIRVNRRFQNLSSSFRISPTLIF